MFTVNSWPSKCVSVTEKPTWAIQRLQSWIC
jgi:hypothetical protein